MSPNDNAQINGIEDARMNKGLLLFQKMGKSITENQDGSWSVPSQSNPDLSYEVKLIGERYVCSCPDFEQREIEFCKHVHAVKFWIASNTYLKEQAKPKVFADDSIQCGKCGSIRVIKYGIASGKQVYKCKDCKRKFVPSLIRKAKYSPETISLTLDLYFSGMSLRKIARVVRDYGNASMSYITVYRWIQKFVPKISQCVNSLTPQLSDTWHADELFVKHREGSSYGDQKTKIAFLWNIMDRKTRFLLASKLSHFRDAYGAIESTKEAIQNSHGQLPEHAFTDSLGAYVQAYRRFLPETKLHQNSGIRKPHANNNRIERLNGTLRERVKVQRGWKSFESKIAEGQRIHYNFVKPHMALAGMTPAQCAGIPIQNSWSELLKLALSNTKDVTARDSTNE